MWIALLGCLGIVLVFFGTATLMRWSQTRTQDSQARARGLIRAAVIEAVGLALALYGTQVGGLSIILLPISFAAGAGFGLIAAKALQIPR